MSEYSIDLYKSCIKPVCPACGLSAFLKTGPYPQDTFTVNRLVGSGHWCFTVEDGRLYRYCHHNNEGPYWGNK